MSDLKDYGVMAYCKHSTNTVNFFALSKISSSANTLIHHRPTFFPTINNVFPLNFQCLEPAMLIDLQRHSLITITSALEREWRSPHTALFIKGRVGTPLAHRKKLMRFSGREHG